MLTEKQCEEIISAAAGNGYLTVVVEKGAPLDCAGKIASDSVFDCLEAGNLQEKATRVQIEAMRREAMKRAEYAVSSMRSA